jgi:hypothetical protein
MSDVTTGSAFNPQFFMNPPWWIGRVEDKEVWSDNIQGETFTNVAEIKGWGQRYKVRVFNWHTGDISKLQPEQMAFCQVVMPVTAGSGHGGASITPAIESGSVVFGFFMDGMAGQEGYIVGLLGNSNNNVPKERGEPAPNQSSTKPTPGGGSPTVSKPPTPPTGPGSAANQPVPSSVDQLSVDQLKKLLDPSKTPSSAVFKAASEARQKAKAQGLPTAEIERQVLAATVKASRQPGADAGGSANCNQGYQQFNNTYKDGNPETAAKVPDNLKLGGTPLSTTEALHSEVQSQTDHDKSSKIKIPLLDVSKKNNGDMKGIQRTMKNLINSVEELKKKYNQVSTFATDATEFASQIQNEISGAVTELSGFSKNIMGGVRGYTLTKLSDEVKKAAPNLFPSEIPKLYQKVEEGMSALNCAFNKITAGMPDLLNSLLNNVLDKMVNTPLCAVENLVAGILDNVLGQIMGVIDEVFSSINSVLGSITGVLGSIGGALGAIGGSMFNALEYVNGIKNFFKCDDPETPVKYNEVAYGYPALPGGDATPTSATENQDAPTSPTGTGANASQAPSGNIVNNTSNSGGAVVVDQEGNIRERITEEFSGRQDILGQLDQAIEVQRAERESNRQNSNPSFTFY